SSRSGDSPWIAISSVSSSISCSGPSWARAARGPSSITPASPSDIRLVHCECFMTSVLDNQHRIHSEIEIVPRRRMHFDGQYVHTITERAEIAHSEVRITGLLPAADVLRVPARASSHARAPQLAAVDVCD